MNDKFNNLETLTKNFLAADADIAAQVVTFEEKLRDVLADYDQHELPAIAVQTTGYASSENLGKAPDIFLTIEVVSRGASLGTIDGKVKEIASLVMDKLRAESPTNDGKGLNENIEIIDVESVQFFPPDNEDNQFTVSAFVNVIMTILEK